MFGEPLSTNVMMILWLTTYLVGASVVLAGGVTLAARIVWLLLELASRPSKKG